jgi:putative transposase
VFAWQLSNTLEAEFCIRAWERALEEAGQPPLISKTDQGAQFTSPGFIDAVQSAGVEVSMDGRGRWIDNRFIERLWRSVKYEDIYLNDYGDGLSAGRGLRLYFGKYNHWRPHAALDNACPVDWYRRPEDFAGQPATWEAMREQPDRLRPAPFLEPRSASDTDDESF